MRSDLLEELNRQVRAWQADQDIVDDEVSKFFRVNRTDLRCLDLIDQAGPMTAGRLADAARLTTGAVTSVIDRLEEKGYVRRVRDEADRRRVVVEITEQARARGQEVFGQMATDAQRMLERYTVAELKALVDFIRRGREMNRRQAEHISALRRAREES